MPVTAAWPAGVNQYVKRNSYRERPERNVFADEMQVGPPLERRYFSLSWVLMEFEGRMTDTEWSALLTFYRATLKDGTLPFTRNHPLLGTAGGTYKFVEVPALGS